VKVLMFSVGKYSHGMNPRMLYQSHSHIVFPIGKIRSLLGFVLLDNKAELFKKKGYFYDFG